MVTVSLPGVFSLGMDFYAVLNRVVIGFWKKYKVLGILGIFTFFCKVRTISYTFGLTEIGLFGEFLLFLFEIS